MARPDSREALDADVVVVGAGPTGLLLATELVHGGASVIVLERLDAADPTIKAGTIGALAAEALERRGLAHAMDAEERAMADAIAKMVAVAGSSTGPLASGLRKVGGHFAGLFLIDPSRQREPNRRFRAVNQQALERMLGTYAGALGISVRRSHEFVDFDESDDAIAVRVRGPEGERALRCRYLVGCDGGRSGVRKRADFSFPGTEPTLTGHQAIVELDAPEKLLPLGWRRTPTGMFAYGPVPGRIFLAQFDGPPADRSAPITKDELEHALRKVTGVDVRITAVKTATRFTDNARQATDYRRGRVLLAGDAAHVHSPFGGQGLNLGLLDAVNLGWKLAATVRGHAPADLLDSYTKERHPVAARVLENTRAQVALMRPDAHTSALRDVVARVMETDEGNRFFGDMMSGLAERYDLGDAHSDVGRFVVDRVLASMPDEAGRARPSNADGRTEPRGLYAAMADAPELALLVDAGDGTAERVTARFATRVRTLRVPSGPSMLVRPDGCIAWATDDGGAAGLSSALERWFVPNSSRPLDSAAESL